MNKEFKIELKDILVVYLNPQHAKEYPTLKKFQDSLTQKPLDIISSIYIPITWINNKILNLDIEPQNGIE